MYNFQLELRGFRVGQKSFSFFPKHQFFDRPISPEVSVHFLGTVLEKCLIILEHVLTL